VADPVTAGAPEQAPAPEGKFDADTAVAVESQDGPDRTLAAVVSPDWYAGRGPHGGYLAAILLRALMLSVEEAGRSPRSSSAPGGSCAARIPSSNERRCEPSATP